MRVDGGFVWEKKGQNHQVLKMREKSPLDFIAGARSLISLDISSVHCVTPDTCHLIPI
jgi:hypothetical protein